MTPDVSRHPEAERLAEYAENRLDAGARAEVEAHLAECPVCRTVVMETMAFLDAEPAQAEGAAATVLPFRPRTWLTAAAAVLAVAAALTIAIRVDRPASLFGPRSDRPELQELIAAVANEPTRPVEGRLSGGFRYGPPPSPTRGAGDAVVSPDIRIAAAKIEKATGQDASADTFAAFGTALLVQHQPDRAIELLQQAVNERNGDPRLLSDLSAAYLARAAASNRPDDLANALEAAERSIRASASINATPLLEARFNRALALEHLFLADQATQAWREYLKVESDPAWADEAKRHIRAAGGEVSSLWSTVEPELIDALNHDRYDVTESLVREWTQRIREYVENELLSTWGTAWKESRLSDAESALEHAKVLAVVLKDFTGDALPSAEVAAIDRCRSRNDAACLRSLATGHESIHRALVLTDAFNFAAATPVLSDALRLLRDGGSPAAGWAEFNLAVATYYRRDITGAEQQLASLQDRVHGRLYKNLEGRIASVRGLIAADLARFDRASAEYQVALAIFQATGEVDNLVAVDNLLADNLRVLGDYRSSWRFRFQALEQLARLKRAQRREGVLLAAARLAETESQFLVALNFEDAALAIARSADGAAARAQVLVRRAASLRQLGDVKRASADLAEVRQSLTEVADSTVAARIHSEALTIEAQIGGLTVESDERLVAALDFTHRAHLDNQAPWLHLLRGRSLVARNLIERGVHEFEEGIQELERGRLAAASEASRVSYFDRAWVLFGEMVSQQLLRGDAVHAFEFAERGRGRTLQDALLRSGEEPATLRTLAAAIEPSTTIVYYAQLQDRLAIWTISQQRTDHVVEPITSAELASLVKRFQFALSTNSSASKRASEALYQAIVSPIKPLLVKATRLIVVPDGDLDVVPFSALRDPVGGRYLIEDYVIGQAPTATLWLHAAREASADHHTTDPQVTLISASSGNSDLGVPAIEGVQREVAAIAGGYRHARLVPANLAGKSTFLAALNQADVVHFAGHAIVNNEYPALSRLVFGGVDESERVLYASELSSRPQARSRLVVLAACSTASGAVSRGEGPISLARPLLTLGVPTVVATLWDVDDRAAQDFFVNFYKVLQRGEDSVTAVRAAQLALLTGPDRRFREPANWAPFVAIGAAYSSGVASPVK